MADEQGTEQGTAQAGGDAEAWESRSDLQLLSDQLHAIELWHRSRRQRTEAADLRGITREMRLDLSRRLEARRREQAALLARAEEQLRRGPELLARGPRAVLVHRREWVRNRVAEDLVLAGVRVVAMLDNGADAIGVTVVEQPDLLLVEDALPMRSGPEVIREIRQYSAGTRIAAHVDGSAAMETVLDAGASAAFTRQAAPAEIAQGLLALVRQRQLLGGRPRLARRLQGRAAQVAREQRGDLVGGHRPAEQVALPAVAPEDRAAPTAGRGPRCPRPPCACPWSGPCPGSPSRAPRPPALPEAVHERLVDLERRRWGSGAGSSASCTRCRSRRRRGARPRRLRPLQRAQDDVGVVDEPGLGDLDDEPPAGRPESARAITRRRRRRPRASCRVAMFTAIDGARAALVRAATSRPRGRPRAAPSGRAG